jgi:hypothetical protein
MTVRRARISFGDSSSARSGASNVRPEAGPNDTRHEADHTGPECDHAGPRRHAPLRVRRPQPERSGRGNGHLGDETHALRDRADTSPMQLDG